MHYVDNGLADGRLGYVEGPTMKGGQSGQEESLWTVMCTLVVQRGQAGLGIAWSGTIRSKLTIGTMGGSCRVL